MSVRFVKIVKVDKKMETVSVIYRLEDVAKMFEEIHDVKERAAIATRSLKSAVESGNLPGLKLLFAHGAKYEECEMRELLFIAMRHPRKLSYYREIIKILVDHGANLDPPDNSCQHLLDYVVRWLRKIQIEKKMSVGFVISSLRNIAEITGDLGILLANDGANLTLQKVLETRDFILELELAIRYYGKVAHLLLRHFLDWGLDPSSSSETIPSAPPSLLACVLDVQNWDAASLLLEYGAYQHGEIVSIYSELVFNDFQAYIDCFRTSSGDKIYKLQEGMEKKLRRRQEVCLMHLKPVLDPICKPFDTAPLIVIVSEYLL